MVSGRTEAQEVTEVGVIKRQDIVIKQGDTFELSIQVVDKISGEPIDMSGWTGVMHVRDDDGNLLIDLDLPTELVVTGSIVTINIESAETAMFTWTDGIYDLFMIDTLSKPHCVVEGRVRVDHNVTVLP
jgi:hypothetical protein